MKAMVGSNRPLVVVANPRSGAIGGLEVALAALRKGGHEVVTRELRGPAQLADLLGGSDGHTVVAAGGDGTLRMLVQHLRRVRALGGTVLGLLPLGTGNDFARSVGIPLDPEAAAGALMSGRARPLDLLVDDAGTVAANGVHCGVGGFAVRSASPLKPYLGRLAYRVGAAWAGARTGPWQLRIDLDGKVLVDGPVLFAGVGNGTTIGGGTTVWPQARPDDGVLDVVVATSATPLSRLELAAALRSGDPGALDGVITGRGQRVRIRGDAVPYVADGEASASRTSRSWRVEPSAWRLITPDPAVEM